jgi:hypothetical protein
MWRRGERTYAVVSANQPDTDVMPVVSYVRRAVE